MMVLQTYPTIDNLAGYFMGIVPDYNKQKQTVLLQALLDSAWFTLNDNLPSQSIVTTLHDFIHEPWFRSIEENLLQNVSVLFTDIMLWFTEIIVTQG